MSNTLEAVYSDLYTECLNPAAQSLEAHIYELLEDIERIDRVSARAKTPIKFIEKSRKRLDSDTVKYESPLEQIQDQIGVRIITFFLDDVEKVAEFILKHFRSIEGEVKKPESDWEFGYFGKHFILHLPVDVTCEFNHPHIPKLFELQIKTLFQHAWSEANHDIGYKPNPESEFNDDIRKIAFASAQAWGADQAFNQLHLSQDKSGAVLPFVNPKVTQK